MKISQHKPKFPGLTDAQVIENRQKHGENLLKPAKRDPWWVLFLEKFEDPVIRLLGIAAILAVGIGLFTGEYYEGLGIIIAILLATTIAFLNEYKASKEFDVLNQVNNEIPVKVIRNSCFQQIPKRNIVFGDIVLVETGEEIPADGKILESVSLKVDESKMTGESEEVEKTTTAQINANAPETTVPRDEVWRGTFVKEGHGILEIIAVGESTKIGEAQEVMKGDEEETPLNIQLKKLSEIIGVLGFLFAGITFVALMVRDLLSASPIIILNHGQWAFLIIVFISVTIALIKIWLPIVFSGIELIGFNKPEWSWLEEDDEEDDDSSSDQEEASAQTPGWKKWIQAIGGGALIFLIGTGIIIFTDNLSSSPSLWLPLNVWREFLEFFMIAVTIIVVAVPEGLGMSVTLSLAYAMRKMTGTNNLVRKMHACETIGAATVICTDKTGTLTQNKMQVFECVVSSFTGDNGQDTESKGMKLLAEAIGANSTANLSRKEGNQSVAIGNATEGALLIWLENQKLDYLDFRDSFQLQHQWTFTTERKFMASLGRSSVLGKDVLYVKGAPEIILSQCRSMLSNTSQATEISPVHRGEIEKSLKSFQSRGMRTLGFALLEDAKMPLDNSLENLAHSLIWQGFIAISDPIRPEVPQALHECCQAGILVKIVTGDNPETALEIARQTKLFLSEPQGFEHMTGSQFQSLSDEDAKKAAQEIRVLSRARPLDKMKLVQLLQGLGHVVAVTGDGTNDAPALHRANVGLAMGKEGTAVAKEASDIILLDDSFPSIVNAIKWGRALYENIQRFILFQATVNVAALGIALIGPFIGIKFPLTVIQMLWVNLIMDTFAALALATEPPHASVMQKPPRNPQDFIVTKSMGRNIFTVGIIFLVVFVIFLQGLQAAGQDLEYGLSLFFTIFILLQFWNLFNARCLGQTHSAFKGILDNKGFVLIALIMFFGQIFIVQFGGKAFRTVSLSLNDWLLIIASTSSVLIIGELYRFIRRVPAQAERTD